eukprot:TRINITY_DN5026_c0_g1_i1.p1 TRINITY_DN5026_c0_g1~~TRINITY_DN5026_c0_g1_i1.p1  ORF type:complete len:339 (+),score=103.58 TRINITY_DN5026_c0_g1_i1:82-1098(+)
MMKIAIFIAFFFVIASCIAVDEPKQKVGATYPATFGSAYSMISLPAGKDTVMWDYKATTFSVLSYFWWTASFNDKPSSCLQDIIYTITVDGEKQTLNFTSKSLSGEDFMTKGVWGHEHFGKGSTIGAVYSTMRIPFAKRLLITGRPTSCVVNPATVWWMARGMRNQPVMISGVALPATARLRQSTISNQLFKRLEYVPLISTNKAGAIWHTQVEMIKTTSPNWIEGCFRIFNGGSTTPTVIGTGFEDYFQSSFTFSGGAFQFPEAGCLKGCFPNTLGPTLAYKVHDRDAIFFEAGGFKFTWRIGDITNSLGQKCHDKGTPFFDPHDATVSTNVWYYEW